MKKWIINHNFFSIWSFLCGLISGFMGMIGEIYELLRMEIEICEKND
jgi:hypothetical protein